MVVIFLLSSLSLFFLLLLLFLLLLPLPLLHYYHHHPLFSLTSKFGFTPTELKIHQFCLYSLEKCYVLWYTKIRIHSEINIMLETQSLVVSVYSRIHNFGRNELGNEVKGR